MSKKGRSASSGSSSSTASSSTSGGASAKKVERRPVLVLYQSKIDDGKSEVLRILTSLEAWARQSSNTPAMSTAIVELLNLGKEISPRLADFSTAFAALISLGFVPEVGTSARAPKFGPGVKVKVETGDWMTYYTKSGLYTKEELSDLTVVRLGVDKEILCKTAEGREILIRTSGHLEPFEATSQAT